MVLLPSGRLNCAHLGHRAVAIPDLKAAIRALRLNRRKNLQDDVDLRKPRSSFRCQVARGAHAVLLLDRAGWHTTGRLAVPRNMTVIFLPSRAPELNPVENLWQHLRANWLSNRVFDTYQAIIDAACEAWNRLLAQPQAITSISMRDWAHVGQR